VAGGPFVCIIVRDRSVKIAVGAQFVNMIAEDHDAKIVVVHLFASMDVLSSRAGDVKRCVFSLSLW